MREIVLDTETTGLDVSQGHKIIEIGALEIMNLVPSGKTLHLYINPERDIDPDATKIHGITDEFVSDKPLFKYVAQEFLDFIKDDKLVIHNASFDMGFLNFEL
ncbi:MAG: exonuclease domain-containing protein, partial [Alphaproteobacteria bacterium]